MCYSFVSQDVLVEGETHFGPRHFSGFACAQIFVSWPRMVIETSFLVQINRNYHVYESLAKQDIP